MQLKEEIEQYQISKGCLFFASNAIPRQFFSSVYFRLRYLVGNGRQVIVLQQQNTDRFLFHDSLDAPILCQKKFLSLVAVNGIPSAGQHTKKGY